MNELQVQKYDRIAIRFDYCPQIIPVILSILNTEYCAFCPISTDTDNDEIINSLERFGAKFLSSFCIDKTESLKLKLINSLSVFESQVFFYKNDIEINSFSHHFCYLIQTSGSTEIPKIVKVPFSCIFPNVECLSKFYKITSDDVIFISSPPTFDPFILDVFLALKNGAALLMITNHLRLNSKKLTKILNSSLIFDESDFKGATIAQMTPSIFKLLTPDLLDEVVFNKNSNLRILTLGEEEFLLIDEIKKLKILK